MKQIADLTIVHEHLKEDFRFFRDEISNEVFIERGKSDYKQHTNLSYSEDEFIQKTEEPYHVIEYNDSSKVLYFDIEEINLKFKLFADDESFYFSGNMPMAINQ